MRGKGYAEHSSTTDHVYGKISITSGICGRLDAIQNISIDHVVVVEYNPKGWVGKTLKVDVFWLEDESLTIELAIGGHCSHAGNAI